MTDDTPAYTPGRHTVVQDGEGFALQAYDGDVIAYGLLEADARLFAHASAMAGVLRAVEGLLEESRARQMVTDVLKAAGL